MTTPADFQDWSRNVRQRVEGFLERTLPAKTLAPARLHDAMRYAVLGGGKRMRALLVFAAGEFSGADPARLDVVAAALELIHAYSLVHDDLPAMDDDVLRRGQPTCHVEFGEATALLVGDSLQSLAFQVLAEHRICDSAEDQLAMIRMLAAASGSRGMAGGQSMDLDSVEQTLTLPELEAMHIHKTGALIRAAVLLGADCGPELPEPEHRALDRYAKSSGLAFQVIDDVLDAEADTATLGKTAGKDAADKKPTYVSIMGLKKAREFALELHAQAVSAVAPCGPGAQRLVELADYIVKRHY